jgi:hypothetical protein
MVKTNKSRTNKSLTSRTNKSLTSRTNKSRTKRYRAMTDKFVEILKISTFIIFYYFSSIDSSNNLSDWHYAALCEAEITIMLNTRIFTIYWKSFKLPHYTLTGFYLTTHNSAGGDDTTGPRCTLHSRSLNKRFKVSFVSGL